MEYQMQKFGFSVNYIVFAKEVSVLLFLSFPHPFLLPTENGLLFVHSLWFKFQNTLQGTLQSWATATYLALPLQLRPAHFQKQFNNDDGVVPGISFASYSFSIPWWHFLVFPCFIASLIGDSYLTAFSTISLVLLRPGFLTSLMCRSVSIQFINDLNISERGLMHVIFFPSSNQSSTKLHQGIRPRFSYNHTQLNSYSSAFK